MIFYNITIFVCFLFISKGERTIMAKKFGKFVLFSAIAGAAAAGAYHYFQSKNKELCDDLDDCDDYDIFDDDLDDDFEYTSDASHTKSHPYVSLDLDNAKEIIGEKMIETIDKTKEKIEQFNVSEKLNKAKEYIESKTIADAHPTNNTTDSYTTFTIDKSVNTTENASDTTNITKDETTSTINDNSVNYDNKNNSMSLSYTNSNDVISNSDDIIYSATDNSTASVSNTEEFFNDTDTLL